MPRQLCLRSSAIFRGIIASWTCAAFLSALALSCLPQWHELIHADAKAPRHECAVTLIGSGNYQQPAPAPMIAAPVPAIQICFVPALRPVWVASPFLGARIFEHAPPALA
jgi:outer membrane biosynthesis protein TonB